MAANRVPSAQCVGVAGAEHGLEPRRERALEVLAHAVDGRAPRVGLGQRPQHLLGALHLLELLRDAAGRRRPVGRAAVREERAQRVRRGARRRLPRRRLDERRPESPRNI